MVSIIVPSDSYSKYLSLSHLQPAPDHVRNLLSGYEITHILGAGGYAKVYKAIGPGGREVALKIPLTDNLMATMDMEVIDRFRSEAELWKRLEHPNIVTLISGNTTPLPHMAMELMAGGNLKQLMKNHALTVGEAVSIMEQVLKGLSFAHRMASVHRDLKPENILFTTDGVAKITDWGIGKFMASAGKSQSVGIKGTLDYCAPEQYNKRQYGTVDWQTDIFQVGVMFYEMLTGVNPFAGEDFADCMGKVLMYEPEPPSVLNQDVPRELDDVIMKAIVKKKENRWESGAVILYELRRINVNNGSENRGNSGVKESETSIAEHVVPPPPDEGNICPDCTNLIGFDNKKLRCKNCQKYFCETCEGWIDKVLEYKGIKLKQRYPLCELCYEKAVSEDKKKIDQRVERERSRHTDKERRKKEKQSLRLLERIKKRNEILDQKADYCMKKGLTLPPKLDLGRIEAQNFVEKGLYQEAIERLDFLLSDMEVHIGKMEEKMINWHKAGDNWANRLEMEFVNIPDRPYYMGVYTVTQSQWKEVMGNAPWKGKDYVREGDKYPASYISWNDCMEFVDRLNEREGVKAYRLPTEDEWEHASRAGSTAKYCFGDNTNKLNEYGWYDKNADDIGEEYAHEVGLKLPNEWGLYDMHGNVWEWCSDWYDHLRIQRVIRGGSWDNTAESSESSHRLKLKPDERFNFLSFRLVRDSD